MNLRFSEEQTDSYDHSLCLYKWTYVIQSLLKTFLTGMEFHRFA